MDVKNLKFHGWVDEHWVALLMKNGITSSEKTIMGGPQISRSLMKTYRLMITSLALKLAKRGVKIIDNHDYR